MGSCADETVLAWCKDNDTTYINGGKLYAGSVTTEKLAANAVTAAKIDTTNLFAQDITATGTIRGLTLSGGSLSIGKTFSVTNAGLMTCTSGFIGSSTSGWKINDYGLTATGDSSYIEAGKWRIRTDYIHSYNGGEYVSYDGYRYHYGIQAVDPAKTIDDTATATNFLFVRRLTDANYKAGTTQSSNWDYLFSVDYTGKITASALTVAGDTVMDKVSLNTIAGRGSGVTFSADYLRLGSADSGYYIRSSGGASLYTLSLSNAATFNGTVTCNSTLTCSGNLSIERGETDNPYASVSNGTYTVSLMVGSGGVNHGIYDNTKGEWMCYADASAAYFKGNADTATKWKTSRKLTIGSTGKNVNGGSNVSWTLAEIGAAAASHTHDYLPLSGGTLTGMLTATNIKTTEGIEVYHATPYIDFHFGNSTSDYTSRIIESAKGVLNITGSLTIAGSLTIGGKSIQEMVYAYSTATQIASGTDLNQLTGVGHYCSASGTISSSLSNTPYTSYGFMMEVRQTTGSAVVVQTIYPNSNGYFYMRRGTSTTNWGSWYKYTGAAV
jgi:hypothetical protein